jgi:hypothetical protein
MVGTTGNSVGEEARSTCRFSAVGVRRLNGPTLASTPDSSAVGRYERYRGGMNIFTRQQWIVLAGGVIIGFIAIYYGLGYDLWTSLVLEGVLVAAAVGAQAWKMSQIGRR